MNRIKFSSQVIMGNRTVIEMEDKFMLKKVATEKRRRPSGLIHREL